jgi:AmmeMemoRadiSam system protein A
MAEERLEFLDLAAQNELLRLARGTIEHYLRTGTKLEYESDDAKLRSKAGAFVSLHRGQMLRGCIGYIIADRPLFETVIDAAVSAATADPRFPAVGLGELEGLDIEISVLTPPEVVDDLENIKVGRDGLIVSSGPFRGLLLPQVATEYGWDRDTFLDHTCRKAGLPADSWRRGNVTIERFSAQVFSESELGK